MNKSLSEKEKLLTVLIEIYDELEELEMDLEASFSELRICLNNEEFIKISSQEQRLFELEKHVKKTSPILSKISGRSKAM